MYYHQSPTTTQIKQVKALRAKSMRVHIDAMKQTTAIYKPIINKLEKLREQELFIENERITGRMTEAQLVNAGMIIEANRRKAARLVAKLTDQMSQSS